MDECNSLDKSCNLKFSLGIYMLPEPNLWLNNSKKERKKNG